MQAAHSSLLALLKAHWVVHVAWPDPKTLAPPHCTPLYYALLHSRKECASAAPSLIFFSDPESEHGQRHRPTLQVGASIALETQDIAQIRGATLRGQVQCATQLDPSLAAQARSDYLQRHPKAAPFLGSDKASLYLMTLTWAKLTDNRRGFGQHLILKYPSPPWQADLGEV